MVRFEGKQYSKAVRTRTKREAMAMLPAFVAEVQSGAYGAAKEMQRKREEAPTFRETADTYMQDYMQSGPDGEATKKAYRFAFNLVAAELGDTRISAITRDQLHRCLRKLHASGGKGGRPLSLATVKLIHAAVSKLLGHAVELGTIAASPVPRFAKLNLDRGEEASQRARRSVVTDGQLFALLDACADDDHALRLWINLMRRACGLRPGEALALRWQDVDLQRLVLHVEHSAKRVVGGGHSRIGRTKTAGSVRSLSIGPELVAILQAERDRQEALLRTLNGISGSVATLQPLLAPPDCVIPSGWNDEERQFPASIEAIRNRFGVAAARAGLPGVSAHWLRHTALSRLLAGGVGLANTARLAGHSDPGTTSRVYAHAIAENEQRAVALLDTITRPGSVVEPLRNAANGLK